MKYVFLLLAFLVSATGHTQQADKVFHPNIRSVKLFKNGDIYSYPVMSLNGNDLLELDFDDMDGDVKNFYYGFQLCNADWSPANLQSYDYIRGFQTTRISNYRNSSISLTRYTHYQAMIPDRSSVPTHSGNYLLRVFLNNDTSDLFFTKRFLITDSKVSVGAQVLQPYNSQLFRTDQRVSIQLNTAQNQLNTMSPQDLKVVILQNNIWPSAITLDRPSVYRGNSYEYSDDASSFPGGKEWRWIDLRTLRLMTDRMQKLVDTTSKRLPLVIVKPDVQRVGQIYAYYRDYNGIYTIENSDGDNPYWQSDYTYVRFTFIPPGNKAIAGKDVYLFGELTNYAQDGDARMDFNADQGIYEKTLFLKEGYYNYAYVTLPPNATYSDRASYENTEGNYYNTENSYTILVYFRPFGARADELIGYGVTNSVTGH